MASDASGGYYIAGSLTKVGSLSRAGVAHIQIAAANPAIIFHILLLPSVDSLPRISAAASRSRRPSVRADA